MIIKTILEAKATGTIFLVRPPRTKVSVTPNSHGYWQHPDFRWNLIPANGSCFQFFQDAGFELVAVEREQADSNGVNWLPEELGDGWFLVLVTPLDGSPTAVFAKPLAFAEAH